MPEKPSYHVDSSGTAKSRSPKAIRASAEARNSLAKILIGGIILIILSIAYVVAFFKQISGAAEILGLLGTGVGFLLGGREKESSSN